MKPLGWKHMTLHLMGAGSRCAVCGEALDRHPDHLWWLRNTWVATPDKFTSDRRIDFQTAFTPCGELEESNR